MEKLNIKILKLAILSIGVAFTSTAFAGPFRMSSKAPAVPQAHQYKGYVFGYGGVDSGASWDTTGAFDLAGDWRQHCPPGYDGHYGFDPTAIPIDWELTNGWTAGGGVGFYSRLFGGSRFEFEGSYTNNDVGDLTYANFALPANFEIETKTAMFNMLKEIPIAKRATGYVGGGVGYAWTGMDGDIDTILYSDNDSGFAWQLIAGVDFAVTERLALFMQYRYLVLPDVSFVTDFGDFTHTTDDNPASHGVLFGARVNF